MSVPYRQLLSQEAPQGDNSTLVPYSKTILGQLQLMRLFVALEHRNLSRDHAPSVVDVVSFLEKVDRVLLPYESAENDPVYADRIKTQKSNTDALWETLLLNSTPSSSSAPSTTQPPALISPLAGEKRGLAATLETHRIRLLAHSAAGAATGVLFFNESLELQTQRVLVQSTTTVEAAARVFAALHGLGAMDAEGAPRTLEQILDLIPPIPGESADAIKGLADDLRELKRLTKYLYDSVKLATRVPGVNGYYVLQELEHRLRSDLEELACDPEHVYKANFSEQAEAAAKRLKENVPGSICPALALVNKPLATPQPPKAPASENGAPIGRDANRQARTAPNSKRDARNRGPRQDPRQDEDEVYEDRHYDRNNRSSDHSKGAYRGGWQRDRNYRG
uniref:Uncharacterized protein n=1 Tax=Cryptomonas curvata TaxID=233186 RepID=A0A7S0MH33_9CRYP